MKQQLSNLKFLDDNLYLSKESKKNINIYLKNKYIKLHGGAAAIAAIAVAAMGGAGLVVGSSTTRNWVKKVNNYQAEINSINEQLEEMLPVLHGRMDLQRDNAIQINRDQEQTNQTQEQTNQTQEQTNQAQEQTNQTQDQTNQAQEQTNQHMIDLANRNRGRITKIGQQIVIIERDTLKFKKELETKVELSNSELKGLLEAQSNKLVDAINKVKTVIGYDIDELRDDLHTEIVSFNTTITELRIEINTTIAQLNGTIKGEIDTLNKKDKKQEEEINKLKQENIKLNEGFELNRTYLEKNHDIVSQILDKLTVNQEYSHKLIYELYEKTDQLSEDSKARFKVIISELQKEKEEMEKELQEETGKLEKKLQDEIAVTKDLIKKNTNEIEGNTGKIEGNTGKIEELYQKLDDNYNNLKTMILSNSNYLRYQMDVANRNAYYQNQFNYNIDTKVNINKQEINDKLEQSKRALLQINMNSALNLLNKINHVEENLEKERTVRHQGSQEEQRIRKAQIKGINKRIDNRIKIEKGIHKRITKETLDRVTSDEEINNRIDQETFDRKNQNKERIKRETGIDKRINQETLDRENQIKGINKKIKQESAFISSVLYSQMGQENEERIKRETGIDKRINQETLDRKNQIEKIKQEAVNRTSDIDLLKDRLSTISSESDDIIKSQSNKIKKDTGVRSSIDELSTSIDLLKDRLSTISSESDARFETQNFINTKMVEVINNFHKKIKKTPFGAFM